MGYGGNTERTRTGWEGDTEGIQGKGRRVTPEWAVKAKKEGRAMQAHPPKYKNQL